MLDCVYLLNKGCLLIPCVMDVISKLSKSAHATFPPLAAGLENGKRNNTPHAAFTSSLAAI